MKGKMFIFLILFLSFFLFGKAQIDNGKVDERCLEFTVHIAVFISPKEGGTGTGFIVSVPKLDSKKRFYLITNKHVIGENYTDTLVLRDNIYVDFYTLNGFKTIPLSIKGKSGIQQSTVILHPDRNVDIALIDCTDVFNNDNTIASKTLDTSNFIRMDEFYKANIALGSEVFAIGYPNSIIDELTRHGILSSLHISSQISSKLRIRFLRKNYHGNDSFFYPGGKYCVADGLIIGGNSGGPIISPKERSLKFYNKSIGNNHDRFPCLVLGIMSGTSNVIGKSVFFTSDNILDLIISDLKNRK